MSHLIKQNEIYKKIPSFINREKINELTENELI